MSGHNQETNERQAVERSSWWPGWIWAIPIAALAIVAYLGVRQLAQSGPTVHVTFNTARGVKPSNTKVQYEGLEVGEVESVRLLKNLQHVEVSLQLEPDMAGHLGPGTRFWIAGQSPSLSDLSSLKTIVTGPYIGIDPHDGPIQPHYQGLSEAPAVKETVPGTHFILHAGKLGMVSRDTPIYYRDLPVGTVEFDRFAVERPRLRDHSLRAVALRQVDPR